MGMLGKMGSNRGMVELLFCIEAIGVKKGRKVKGKGKGRWYI